MGRDNDVFTQYLYTNPIECDSELNEHNKKISTTSKSGTGIDKIHPFDYTKNFLRKHCHLATIVSVITPAFTIFW